MRALLWVVVAVSALIAVAAFVVIVYLIGQPVEVK
jgi:hypothetical protein